MSARRRARPAKVRSPRDVVLAIGAAVAVVVVAAALVWLIRPRDDSPDVTDVSDEVPELTVTTGPAGAGPTAPPTTASATTATTTPAPTTTAPAGP